MNTHKAILSIDLGTQTGWALQNEAGLITSGTLSLRSNRFEGGGMRYLRFKHWLDEILAVTKQINYIYFEEVNRHVGTAAAHAYGGFLAQLTSWCESEFIPYRGVPVQTIKKFVTNKGNANKLEVIKATKALGHNPQDDNEADALALLYFARKDLHFSK